MGVLIQDVLQIIATTRDLTLHFGRKKDEAERRSIYTVTRGDCAQLVRVSEYDVAFGVYKFTYKDYRTSVS